MAKKPNPKPEMVMFDIVYEDGTQNSNRRVPGELLKGLEADELVRSFLETQDADIASKSGRPRGPIKTIERAR